MLKRIVLSFFLALLLLPGQLSYAQWGFTATLTYSGSCWGSGYMPSFSIPVTGLPTKSDCESLRNILLGVNSSIDNCRVYYRCTSCTGSNIANTQQLTAGVAIAGVESGRAFFSPNPGQSTQDWINSVQKKMQALGFGNALENGDIIFPSSGNNDFDQAYQSLMKEQEEPVAYIGKSKVPIYTSPSDLTVNTQRANPSLPSVRELITTSKNEYRDILTTQLKPSVEAAKKMPPTFTKDLLEIESNGPFFAITSVAVISVSRVVNAKTLSYDEIKEDVGELANLSRSIKKVAVEDGGIMALSIPEKSKDKVVDKLKDSFVVHGLNAKVVEAQKDYAQDTSKEIKGLFPKLLRDVDRGRSNTAEEFGKRIINISKDGVQTAIGGNAVVSEIDKAASSVHKSNSYYNGINSIIDKIRKLYMDSKVSY